MNTPNTAARLEQATSLCELFQETAAAHPDKLALSTVDGSLAYTWREYAEHVRRLAGGLAALGVRKGDTVAIMLTNRSEFHLVDAAVYHLGAIPFSVYNTNTPAQISYQFGNAGTHIVVCEKQFLPRVLEAKAGSAGDHVVCLDEVVALADPAFDFDGVWRTVTRRTRSPSSTPPAPQAHPRAWSGRIAARSPAPPGCSASPNSGRALRWSDHLLPSGRARLESLVRPLHAGDLRRDHLHRRPPRSSLPRSPSCAPRPSSPCRCAGTS